MIPLKNREYSQQFKLVMARAPQGHRYRILGYVAVLSIPNDPDLQTPDFHIQTDKQTMDHLQTFKIVGLIAQAKEYQAHVNICYQTIVLNVLYYSQY